MAQTTNSRSAEDRTIVDADVHPDPLLEEIASYVEEPYRREAERLAKRAGPLDLYDRYMGTVEEYPADGPETIREHLIDQFGVDYPILTPLNSLLEVRNPRKDLTAPLMQATNDWLLDRFLDEDDAFYGMMQLSTRDPEAAAAEIDRVGDEDGIVGVLFYNSAAAPPMGDAEYDPIYRAAEDHGLQVAFHGGTSQLQYGFPRLDEHLETWFEASTCAHSLVQQVTLISLVRNGTFEKFPGLSFVFLESGMTWSIFLRQRLNDIYWKREQEAPLLERSPEEYIRERCYFGTQPMEEANDPQDLQQSLELVGPESILFSSDYPHWDFDDPDLFENYPLTFDDEAIDGITNANAVDVFGLDL